MLFATRNCLKYGVALRARCSSGLIAAARRFKMRLFERVLLLASIAEAKRRCGRYPPSTPIVEFGMRHPRGAALE
jgi:hypothetical protein